MNLQKVFGFGYNTDLTLSVWKVNNAISQTYTQFNGAAFNQNIAGRSYTLSLRSTV